MARDWQDLFVLDHDSPSLAPPEPEREERRRGFFKRLRENMRKTREALAAEVQATLFEGDLDEADVGAPRGGADLRRRRRRARPPRSSRSSSARPRRARSSAARR